MVIDASSHYVGILKDWQEEKEGVYAEMKYYEPTKADEEEEDELEEALSGFEKRDIAVSPNGKHIVVNLITEGVFHFTGISKEGISSITKILNEDQSIKISAIEFTGRTEDELIVCTAKGAVYLLDLPEPGETPYTIKQHIQLDSEPTEVPLGIGVSKNGTIFISCGDKDLMQGSLFILELEDEEYQVLKNSSTLKNRASAAVVRHVSLGEFNGASIMCAIEAGTDASLVCYSYNDGRIKIIKESKKYHYGECTALVRLGTCVMSVDGSGRVKQAFITNGNEISNLSV